MYLIPGILGFIACCLFDLNKIRWHSKVMNSFFIIGSLLIVFSTAGAFFQSDFSTLLETFQVQHLLFLVGMILSGAALIYILFFALPFENTYVANETLALVDHGVYALCRHPGFWMLALFYIFSGLLLSNRLLLMASVIYSVCNLIYIYIQDCYIFPHYIRGYDEYKQAVPFLIPNRNSIQKAFGPNGRN